MALSRAYKIGVFDTATWAAVGATVTTTTTTPIRLNPMYCSYN